MQQFDIVEIERRAIRRKFRDILDTEHNAINVVLAAKVEQINDTRNFCRQNILFSLSVVYYRAVSARSTTACTEQGRPSLVIPSITTS